MQLFKDLQLPSNYVRHQMARKAAFTWLGMLVGAATGMGLYYSGYTLAAITLSAISSWLTTSAATTLLFTDARTQFTKWFSDYIDPPIAVTIPTPENNPVSAERQVELVKLISEQTQTIELSNLEQFKTNLKELFKLRSFSILSDDQLDNIEVAFNQSYGRLLQNIHSYEDWDKPDNVAMLQSLIGQAVIYSNALLAKMEQELRESNEPITTASISKNLVNQRKRYCRSFLNSGIIDLYHQARAKAYFGEDRFGNRLFRTINHHDKVPAYYENDTTQNRLRKAYNSFVKNGFYQRYGNKAFDYQLRADDQRFANWTQKDSKRSRDFRPMPDMRPT